MHEFCQTINKLNILSNTKLERIDSTKNRTVSQGSLWAIHYIHPRGVTSIYTGTGRAIFGVPFLEQEINFGVSFLVRL